MYFAGSDDGVYRLPAPETDALPRGPTKVLESGRVLRLTQFDGIDGLFAATKTGLYRSVDGEQWTALDVPQEHVYVVGAIPDGNRLFAGTRPAAIYATTSINGDTAGETDWSELEGFQELPSRDEWRLPRHDDLAQVRDVHVDPEDSNRLVAGVEVGGVHVSPDGGETWSERADGVHDDVHELHVVDAGTYFAATGDGLYRTRDRGRCWTRLDRSVTQSYFRRAFSIGDSVFASAALSNSSTWNDPDADPALFVVRGDSLEPLEIPAPDETVTGMTDDDGALVVATHRGRLFVRRDGDDWLEAGEFPVPGQVTGRYTPVTVYDADRD
ncbi:WD40/YVTN/BNR-like repeat-containing protein [Halopiger djelfimassiliensis]|uniref:WD40/YVTN/BNR-like repeat-containing protein n=1 Tax=Halopiger djelfimassiliensis TaxID=1293047 RepID=UPI000A4340F7|nr:hypothetical protein [Halopiger djelfimassiliensis]